MSLPIDYPEICRYLGYRGDARPGAGTEAAIRACAGRLAGAVHPRAVSHREPLSRPGGGVLELGPLRVESRDLAKALDGCEKVIFFAATLGVEADRLIARAQAGRVSEALFYQASAAALIETYCDQVNEVLRAEARKEGWYLRPRFSPGYGDFALDHQRAILQILDAPRRIGLTVTDSLLLAPVKSVTAVIGMSRTPRPGQRAGCAGCGQSQCPYRREDAPGGLCPTESEVLS